MEFVTNVKFTIYDTSMYMQVRCRQKLRTDVKYRNTVVLKCDRIIRLHVVYERTRTATHKSIGKFQFVVL